MKLTLTQEHAKFIQWSMNRKVGTRFANQLLNQIGAEMQYI